MTPESVAIVRVVIALSRCLASSVGERSAGVWDLLEETAKLEALLYTCEESQRARR